MLAALSINEYAEQLASKSSTPGGGSAAALTGLLGVSLIEMSVNLTLGRPQYAEHEDVLKERIQQLAKVHVRLQELVDRDAVAFGEVMAAYRMPKNSENEKADRDAGIQLALKQAAEVPLEIARCSLEALEIGKVLLGRINPQVISDLAVGAQNSCASVMGALLNTSINLPLLTDKALANALKGQLLLVKTAADELLHEIQAHIYSEDPFTVMQAESVDK